MADEDPTPVRADPGKDETRFTGLVAGRDLHFHVAPPPGRAHQFQLPPDIADFTGRDDALHMLQNLLLRSEGQATSTVVVSIAGKAGVGKTALATRVAHQAQPYFPDGQFYVNLRGGEDRREDPGLVLGEFLLGLGVARASIPEDLEQRAARYRSQLAGHRILIVLDNAVDEAQVLPLLPGSPGCAALIISRSRLVGLPGVNLFHLDVLGLDEGVELLAKIAGRERIDAQPEEARRIVRLCGYLPLALRIAGGKLAARQHWTPGMLANRLADDHNLLSELRLHDLEVRASFELSYRDLEKEERRAFRLLALLKAPDLTAWVASALFNCEMVKAEELLDRLVEAQVLEAMREPQAAEVRYQFHSLLRAFARERLWSEEPPAQQEAALQRALDAHVILAEYAAGLLEPGRAEVLGAHRAVPTRWTAVAERIAADPAAWFAAERVNLISMVEQADAHGVPDVVWRLARALNYFLKLRTHWTDWEHTQRLALRAARQAGDDQAAANALRSLGDVATTRQRFEEAAQHLNRAMVQFRSLGDQEGEAWTNIGLGNIGRNQGLLEQAITNFESALSLFNALDDRRGQGWALEGLAAIYRIQSRFGESLAYLNQGLTLFREVRDRQGEAYCLSNLGLVHRDNGQLQRALEWFDQAQPIFRELADHQGETFVLLNKGHIYREQGRLDEAILTLKACLAAFREMGEPSGEAWTLLNLGMARQAQGRIDEANVRFHHCLTLFHELNDRRGTAWTLLGMGEAYREQGRLTDALACLNRSLQILEELGDRFGRAKVLRSYGLALAASGDRTAATEMWRAALATHNELGASQASDVESLLGERGESRN
jgi:tetratricopeptide (TPR) repeat protein